MAELVRNDFSVEELHIVHDEKIDRPKLLLEGKRRLRLQRGSEAIHEFLCCQVQNISAARCDGLRDRLHEMRFAETDIRVDIKRIVFDMVAHFRRGDARGGLVRHRIGRADEKCVECHALIERRSDEALAFADFFSLVGALGGCKRSGAATIRCLGKGKLCHAIVVVLGSCGSSHRRADSNDDFDEFGPVSRNRILDVLVEVALYPALQEGRGNGQIDDARMHGVEFDSTKPRVELRVAEFGAQSLADAFPPIVHHAVLRFGEKYARSARNRFVHCCCPVLRS